MNRGYLPNIKNRNTIRILSMNPNELRPEDIEKTIQLIDKATELQIDAILLSSLDSK